ncbi:50S ribosomal protein L1 [Legionella sp. W05-934-2]|uniref:50S ribosomal protein L1 n=1 Tax=Legionella sp. W05-934-2 TaxID=1198649 RepID=UPI0034619039
MAITKKLAKIREVVVPGKIYPLKDAIEIIKQFESPNFKDGESLDVAVMLGVDPKKADQMIRSATNLPKGTGKTVRVAVFAQGENAEKAKSAGADVVGMDDLAEQIKSGNFDFDVVIATPDAMRIVGQLGQILGPRGLMPNPKVGTVTPNVEAAVQNAKSGQVRYRTDKNGIIHCSVAKVKFSIDDIIENVTALIKDLKAKKPASSKGIYLKQLSLSSTMGPGLTIDISSIDV